MAFKGEPKETRPDLQGFCLIILLWQQSDNRDGEQLLVWTGLWEV